MFSSDQNFLNLTSAFLLGSVLLFADY